MNSNGKLTFNNHPTPNTVNHHPTSVDGALDVRVILQIIGHIYIYYYQIG